MIWMNESLQPTGATGFGHMISDESLWELHDFAAGIGLGAKAFDHDRYTLPKGFLRPALEHGARPVGEDELAARLAGSGLGMPSSARRPVPSDRELLERWPLALDIGKRVLARWREPHRRYHDASHLAEVLDRLESLAGEVPRPVRLAAWYHDAVYDGVPGQDEEASAALADSELRGVVSVGERAEVARLIRLTIDHSPDQADQAGALLCDADLAILAAVPGRYHVSLRDIRYEYRALGRRDFLEGRRALVEGFVRAQLFHTPQGLRQWQQSARDNLEAERLRLASGSWLPDPC